MLQPSGAEWHGSTVWPSAEAAAWGCRDWPDKESDGKRPSRGFVINMAAAKGRQLCPAANHQTVALLTFIYLLCRSLCHELAPSSQRLCESFGIPDHLIAAPIAGGKHCHLHITADWTQPHLCTWGVWTQACFL